MLMAKFANFSQVPCYWTAKLWLPRPASTVELETVDGDNLLVPESSAWLINEDLLDSNAADAVQSVMTEDTVQELITAIVKVVTSVKLSNRLRLVTVAVLGRVTVLFVWDVWLKTWIVLSCLRPTGLQMQIYF